MKLSFQNVIRIINDRRYDLTELDREKLLKGHYVLEKNTDSGYRIVFT